MVMDGFANISVMWFAWNFPICWRSAGGERAVKTVFMAKYSHNIGQGGIKYNLTSEQLKVEI